MITFYRISVITLIILIGLATYAQPIVPSKPTASAENYSRFADVDPNLYTGSLSQQIPIATVQEGPLSIPISIAYHTGGLRAHTLSSEVGLGWILSAGGVISRRINGLPDDGYNPEPENFHYGFIETGINVNDSMLTFDLLDDIEDQKQDPAADIFNFNFGGFSGNFMIDKTGVCRLIEESEMKIEFKQALLKVGTKYSNYSYFKITTADGTEYHFGDETDDEFATVPPSSPNREMVVVDGIEGNKSFATSWYLHKIVSHDGLHEINITNVSNNYTMYTLQNCTMNDGDPDCEMFALKNRVFGKVVDKIETSMCTVDMVHTYSRADLLLFSPGNPQAKRLTRIDVTEGGLKKEFHFNQSYFSSGSEDDLPDHLDFPGYSTVELNNLKRRLKLNSVQIKGGATSLPPYTFNYYGITPSVTDGSFFATQMSQQIDHWGFFNGGLTNNLNNFFVNIIPSTTISWNGFSKTEGSALVQRDSHENSMRAGLLSKMTVPLGGATTFTYGANRYGANNDIAGGMRISAVETSDGDTDVTNNIKRTYSYLNANNQSSGILYKEPKYGGIFPDPNVTSFWNYYFGSQSWQALQSFEGFHIGYSRAKISYNDNGVIDGNGSKIYEYYNDSGDNNDIVYPDVPENDRTFRGQLKAEYVYHKDGTELASSRYFYNNSINGLINDYMHYVEFVPGGSVSQKPNRHYRINKGITQLDYVESYQEGIMTRTDYLYSADNKNIPKFTTTKDDVGSEIGRSTVKTTSAYNGENPILVPEYFSSHNINIPFSQSNRINGNTNMVQLTNYNIFNNVARPDNIERTYFAPSQTAITEIDDFKTYDVYGMLTSMRPFGSQVDHTFEYNNTSHQLLKSCVSTLCKEYKYRSNNQSRVLEKTTAVDGTTMSYDYDDLHRVINIKDDCTLASSDIKYFLFNDGTKSYTETTIDYQSDPLGLSQLTQAVNREYYDGLGRTLQTIGVDQAANGSDQISGVAYDNQGRSHKVHETFASGLSGGIFVNPPSPFTLTTYEPSPLNRPATVSPPVLGDITYQYGTNTSAVTGADNTIYGVGSLFKQTIIDGDSKQSINYTDIRGRTILSRRANSLGTLYIDTKYDYDTKNRLLEVIPQGSSLGNTQLNFNYTYDAEDKIITKKVPSKDVMEYTYDDRDLLIGYQDAYLRGTGNEWYAYNYDDLGRQLMSGIVSAKPMTASVPINSYLTKTAYSSATGSSRGKVTDSWSKILQYSNTYIHTTSTYDDCGRIDRSHGNSILSGGIRQDSTVHFYDGASGIVRTREKYYNPSTSSYTSIISDQEIDDDGRLIQSTFKLNNQLPQTINHLKYTAKDQVMTKYIGGAVGSHLQKVDFEYLDNRMLHKVNGGVSSMTDLFGFQINYDDSQDLPGLSPGIDYYNGNIKNIAWQRTGENIQVDYYYYNYLNRLEEAGYLEKNTPSSGLPVNSTDYGTSYSYDDRGNLMTLTRNMEINGVSTQVDNLSYDYSSNGDDNQVNKIIDDSDDNLGYKSIDDNLEYEYDDNGNMIKDPQKGITITYNHLDLPELITWGDGKAIDFLYDGHGALHKKLYRDGSTTLVDYDYVGRMQFLEKVPYSIMHPEGRVVNADAANCLNYVYLDHLQTDDGTFRGQIIESIGDIKEPYTQYLAGQQICLDPGFEVMQDAEFLADIVPPICGSVDWKFEWDVSDHLGNLRMVFSDINNDGSIDHNSEVIQRTDYYPYGMRRSHTEASSLYNTYQYNGIDHENAFGLDWNMATYRSMDGAIGSWGQVDPKAESFKSMSPYCSMNNNPISNVDPDGDNPILIGAAIGLLSNGISNLAQGNNFFQGGLQAAAFGAIGGGVSSTIGGAAAQLRVASAYGGAGWSAGAVTAFQAGAHAITGGALSTAQSGNFWQGAASGAFSSLTGSAIGDNSFGQWIGGGLSGGVGSYIAGGDFWQGAGQGLITGGLNHAATHFANYVFKPGESPFEIEERVAEVGEGGTFGYSEFRIRLKQGVELKHFDGSEVLSGGFGFSTGVGNPFNISVSQGSMVLDNMLMGSSIKEVFSSTNYIRLKSVASVVKFARISGSASHTSPKLWHSTTFGTGVFPFGYSSGGGYVKFK